MPTTRLTTPRAAVSTITTTHASRTLGPRTPGSVGLDGRSLGGGFAGRRRRLPQVGSARRLHHHRRHAHGGRRAPIHGGPAIAAVRAPVAHPVGAIPHPVARGVVPRGRRR